MEYINQNRKLGLSGLMRVMNDAQTLAASIDSCVDALDELIITYNDCTDDSPQIIERKRQQYPEKIIVIPYPYHVMGINLSDEEYEYVKTLPDDSPNLLASYYNNALKHVNYKYVVKIDADQIYFADSLRELRDGLVNTNKQSKIGMFIGRLINTIYCQRRESKYVWSRKHPTHYLQYILVPLFKKQYSRYVLQEFKQGNVYLSLSGINVIRFEGQWYAPIGAKSKSGIWWPYNGEMDTLVFEATDETYYVPWDMINYQSTSGMHTFIERFKKPEKKICILGFYWYHLKLMQKGLYEELMEHFKNYKEKFATLTQLSKMSYSQILTSISEENNHRKTLFNFVNNMDRVHISKHKDILNTIQ